MSVAVVVDKSAARIPARFGAGLYQAALFRDIGKCAVAVVSIERILSVVSDEQIVVAVVIVVAHTAGLSPTGAMFEARTLGDVGKRAVAIVLEQMAVRLLACWRILRGASRSREKDRASHRYRSRKKRVRSRWFQEDICSCLRRRKLSWTSKPDSFTTSTKLTPSGVPSIGDLGPGGAGSGLAS